MGEIAFNSAKGVYTMFGIFFQQVVEEYGLEAAMELHRKSFDMMGQGFAAMIKEQYGDDPDLEAIGTMFKEDNESGGIETEQIVESPDRVIHRNPKCPRYAGFKDAGMSDDLIDNYCDVCVKAMAPHFAKVGLKYEISDFSAPDGKCEEIISKIK